MLSNYLESVSHSDNIDFFLARKSGAKKIADSAKEKGGVAMLTYHHFKVKDKAYNQVIKAIENGENISYFKKKCLELKKQLNLDDLSPIEFQKVMGELEVFGESYLKLLNS